MAEEIYKGNRIRSYEVSIWTLQDRFLSVLKWATMDCKGQIQEPEVVLRDDGTQEFSFSIPKFYYNGASHIINPMWLHLENQPLEANMQKLKVIFNKNTEEEKVFEFLVTSVTYDHQDDNVDINVKAEGLAFHELGKLGYKIALSEANYTLALDEWELNGLLTEQPKNNLQFWNDIVFKDKKGNWKTNWTYELQMDWSSFSSLYADETKRSDTLYEDEYISSWQVSESNQVLPRAIQATREKCRIIDVSSSNIYNITQTIAEQFGVFCRYEYEHDENYQIVGRRVIYYNNYIQDLNGHIDLTYPYSSAAITRTVDNSNIVTKMFVQGVDYDSDVVTIMDVEANKTKEDYLLNFDYLHEVQGITDEQYEAIQDFEASIHKINNSLISVQERIRVLQNQLTIEEANATTYRNAAALDVERYEAAGRKRAELTGGTNVIPLNGKPCKVMSKEGSGLYINIGWDGVNAGTLKIYRTSNLTGSQNAYSDLIEAYNQVYDEFHNLIRIDHMSATGLAEGDTVWLVGEYNPTLAEDNIQKVWAARKANDEALAAAAEKNIEKYSWYLYGQQVGYARVGSCMLTEAKWIPAVALNGNVSSEYALKASNIVGQCRVVTGIPEGTLYEWDEFPANYFANVQDDSNTPDLFFYQDYYIEEKEQLISKFERMMGPALREGYWQPENYHDYGDIYKDELTISYRDENITAPSTDNLQFIWDGDKYYDSEEPLIYTADAAGNVEQHLTIDLSDCLEDVSKHLEDLSFVYCNPSNVATIDEIRENQIQTKTKIDNFAISNTGIIPFFTKLDNIVDDYNNIEQGTYTYINENTGVSYNYKDLNNWSNPESGIGAKLSELQTSISNIKLADKENEPTIKNTSTINYQDRLDDTFDAWTAIKIDVENALSEIKKIISGIHIETAGRSHIFENLMNQLNNIKGRLQNLLDDDLINLDTGIVSLLNNLINQDAWIRALENSIYSSFRIGSGCELGWIFNKDNNERKPVLIVTGAKSLEDNIIKFIVSNYYTISRINSEYDTIEYVEIKANDNAKSFIGYPLYDVNGDQILNRWGKIKEIGGNADSIIGATYTDRVIFTRKIPMADYDNNGYNRAPKPQEYTWIRQYPRLYFNSLKLKSEEIKIYQQARQLKEFEEYYTLQDDRSVGINVKGIGYYTTIKPECIYAFNGTALFSVVYSLSNIDVAIYLDALNVMNENSRPKVSYDVELSVLNPEFVHTAYRRLNQIVHINDNDLQLENVSGYISSVTMKLDKPWEDTVEIKNYETKFEDLFSTIVAQTEAMKSTRAGLNTAISAFTSGGLIDSDVIYNSINSANLNLSFNQGKLTIDQNEGIWGTSDTGVVAFRGGGIFTATQKDNSGNWIWNTGILPSGINADLITSGQLDTNKIKVYAGNELRFQWNGEGLYAYKSFISDDQELASIIAITVPNNKIDQKQYVKFNSDGLFLISEKGAYYKVPTATSVDGNTIYAYDILPQTTTRVEISWQGLKLRNWKNQDVFYADPDTGDLTLKGSIIADSGTIGGWTITDEMLSGDGVHLVSNNNSSNNTTAGIYLTNNMNFGQSIVIDGIRCYLYEYIDENNEKKECYYPKFNVANNTQTLEPGEKVYVKEYTVVSVEPRYLDIVHTANSSEKIEAVTTNEAQNGRITSADGVVTVDSLNSHMYIVRAVGSQTHIQDENNIDIEYDGDTTPTAEWYQKITQIEPDIYTQYIKENKAMAYVNKILSTTNSVTLTTITNIDPTFSVRAIDGMVSIRKGQVGNYTINTVDGGSTTGVLSNSELQLDNYFMIDDQHIDLGQVFYNITANSSAGTFSLIRLNGEIENFNVAAMQAYKNAVAAAGKINLKLTFSGNTVTAVATNGLGSSVTETMEVNTNTGTATVSNTTSGTQCNGCTNSCAQGCNGNCTGGCNTTCKGTCEGDCGSDCGGDCELGCKGGCYFSCSGGCSNDCKNDCGGDCEMGCTNSCYYGCNTTCKNRCKTVCTEGCANTCQQNCTSLVVSHEV